MNRTEKVREAVKTLASMYAAWPTGPAAQGQPMPERLSFGVSLRAVLQAREALAILDGCVVVPREITPAIGHALESNFAECTPPSDIHAANWRDAWANAITAEEGE